MSRQISKRPGRPAGSPPPPRGFSPRWLIAAVVTLLGLFLVTQYTHALHGPFVGDDYLFLDKARLASFASLWLPRDLAFHYYRPISRELHYWALTRAFGPRELPFHIASMVLALGVGTVYFLLIHRLAGVGVASIATAAVFALAAWGAVVIWPAGSQDLWMLLFALATLLSVAQGRAALAALLFALALLSKETAAVVPAIALAQCLAIDRLPARDALRRTAGLWVVAAVWAAFHPLIGGRFLHPIHDPPIPDLHLPLVRIAWLTLRTVVNLNQWPDPLHGWGATLGTGAIGAILLCAVVAAGIAWSGRRDAGGPAHRTLASPARVVVFGASWAVLAWCPLAIPTLGWHAYYGMLGMLGAWCALAALLVRRRLLAFGVVAALALVRAGLAETPSRDWGAEWFQRRAADFGAYTRDFFLSRYPTLPSHSRVFLAGVPGSVGLMPGGEESAAFRVWYRDTTLHTYFTSRYRPRRPGQPEGRDFMFTYDSTRGWREDTVVVLPEDPSPKEREAFAAFMWKLGRFGDARVQYQRLVALEPTRWDHAFNLGSCIIRQGDSTGGARWYRRAAALPGAPPAIRRAAAGGALAPRRAGPPNRRPRGRPSPSRS